MKKRFLILFLMFSMFFCGCGSAKREISSSSEKEYSYNSEEDTLATENDDKKHEEKSVSSFCDDTIQCDYDSSILKYTEVEPNSNLKYSTIFTSTTSRDPVKAVTNGNCVYAGIIDLEDTSGFLLYPEDFVKSLFSGVFKIDSDSDCSVNLCDDGNYEFTAKKSDLVCKGKVLYVNDNPIFFEVYIVSSATEKSTIDAFDMCYNSIKFVQSMPKDITSGDFFNRIISVCPNASIYSFDNNVNIRIYIAHTSNEEDCLNFFETVSNICTSCQLENEGYDYISFEMFVDNKIITDISLSDYISSTSFSTSEPVCFDDNYDSYISEMYYQYFSECDRQNKFDDYLNSLK